MIDTHSHLFNEEFDDDILDCINRCKEANVNKIILVGFSHDTNIKTIEYAKKYDIFYPTCGLHPSEATKDYLKDFEDFKEFISDKKIYAIGECGLDYHWDKTYQEEQKKLFRLQCELAIELDLPIIVHMRDATKDTFDILKDYKGRLRGVMHCYSGSLEMAYEFLKLGFYISLGGPVTFKNAKEPKEVALNVPIDKLLLETDCPYLAPVPFRGKRNESSFVSNIYEYVANLRGITIDELDAMILQNCKRLFRI